MKLIQVFPAHPGMYAVDNDFHERVSEAPHVRAELVVAWGIYATDIGHVMRGITINEASLSGEHVGLEDMCARAFEHKQYTSKVPADAIVIR